MLQEDGGGWRGCDDSDVEVALGMVNLVVDGAPSDLSPTVSFVKGMRMHEDAEPGVDASPTRGHAGLSLGDVSMQVDGPPEHSHHED